MSTVLQRLLKSIRSAAIYNPDVQVAPACILWPDKGRQWEAVIPRLQKKIPELLVLGDFDLSTRTGPAIWLRCVIAGKIREIPIPDEMVPILYLPGVGRQDLRAVESCPEQLKPLAELQYRGVIWSQINAKDWTILAFLKSKQGGLGLDVAQDKATINAMQLALSPLLDVEIDLLKGKRLDKDDFNALLIGGDPVRDLLQWLDQGDAFRNARGENEWRAFVEVCKSRLAFDPENDGILAGAARLAERHGPWEPIWERFCEAPKRYPNIPARIRKCKMPQPDLLSSARTHGGWPQWNEKQEAKLRNDLMALSNLPPHEARKQIEKSDAQHSERRNLVWAEIGEAPLACALEHLTVLAKVTATSLAAGTVEDMVAMYINTGWETDNAVLCALACVEKQDDLQAVTTAIRAIYLPWAEEAARYLQKVVEQNGYPGGDCFTCKTSKILEEKECVLFVDGLRFDAAKRLAEYLSNTGLHVEETVTWAALPTVTATAKPAVAARIFGLDFESRETSVASEFSAISDYHFKKVLNASVGVMEKHGLYGTDENQHSTETNQNKWCEFGDIDHEGHVLGWKLAKYLNGILGEIKERIESLIQSGWKSVRVVTDHGWLLMPGGLPKTELPSALTENKWGRCAVIKPGANVTERLFSWYWNPNQYFALADGISCYRKGQEYAHGGLSLQECLTLELTVFSQNGLETSQTSIEITDVVWKGLRCKVAVDGEFSSLMLDIRKQAGNASSSIVMNVKPIKTSGLGSVVVEDEDLEGTEATIVLLNEKGELVAQQRTIIGGGNT